MGRETKQEIKTELNGTRRQGVENKNRISLLFIIVFLSFIQCCDKFNILEKKLFNRVISFNISR